MGRPTKEKYYLNIAEEVSRRSTCMSVQIGAVIVKDDQIIATGYVGAPRKTLDCYERGNCLRRELKVPSGHRYELCRSVHAEQNAIINAARAGVNLLGADIYLHGKRIWEGKNELINGAPCFICKKMVINAGISKFITHDKEGKTKRFDVGKWADAWKHKDMFDDMDLFDAGQYGEKS